jgi:hypothetical protein
LKNINEDFLYSVNSNNKFGYINNQGDTIIKLGKYQYCFTDTFRKIAIVLKNDKIIAIDRNECELFEVFKVDNGPDYVSDGLFRIIKNNKIGFANVDGKIIIDPQFDCAFPFENGKAKVSKNCKTISDGENSKWESDNWFYISKP